MSNHYAFDLGPFWNAVVFLVYIVGFGAALYCAIRAISSGWPVFFREYRRDRRERPDRHWFHSYEEAGGRGASKGIWLAVAFLAIWWSLLLFTIVLVAIFGEPVE